MTTQPPPDETAIEVARQHFLAMGIDLTVTADTRAQQRAELEAQLHENNAVIDHINVRSGDLEEELKKLQDLKAGLKRDGDQLRGKLADLDPLKDPKKARRTRRGSKQPKPAPAPSSASVTRLGATGTSNPARRARRY